MAEKERKGTLTPNSPKPEGPQDLLLLKALKGQITDVEYSNVIRNTVKNENKKTEAGTQVTLNYHSLDFNGDKSLLPVIDFEDKVKFSGRASVILKNSGKENLTFEPVIQDNPKVYIEATPSGVSILKHGASAELIFDVRVFCTTRVIQVVKININKVKKTLMKKKTNEAGSLYLALKMQTELSTSIDNDDIKRGREIGRGAYGVVFEAAYREEEIALKELNIEQLVEEELILVKRELANMSKIKSRYIVQFIGATLIKGQPVCLAMEYLKSGNLTKLLESRPLSNFFKAKLALDVARGMNYLHANNIGHRDLKSDNVLVFATQEDAPLNLKITDFGTSKASIGVKQESNYAVYDHSVSAVTASTYNKDPKNNSKGVGTPIYQAPEILEGSSSFDDQQIDVYSFGVLLFQIFSQVQPYSQAPYDKMADVREIANFVRKGKRMDIPKEWPSDIRDLIEACWQQEPGDRPSFAQVIVPSLTKILAALQKVQEQEKLQQSNSGPTPTQYSHLPSHPSSANLVPTRSGSSLRESVPTPNSPMSPQRSPRISGSISGSGGNQVPIVSTGSGSGSNQGSQASITHYQNTQSFDQLPITSMDSSSTFTTPVTPGSPMQIGPNVPIPPGNLEEIGWYGEISRGDTIDKLQYCAKGTFLIRWSGNRSCFVLSYQNSTGKAGVKHIDSIFLNKEGKIEVLRADNSRPTFGTMGDYIQTLKDNEKILQYPLRYEVDEKEYQRF